jgi:hypothetical protein
MQGTQGKVRDFLAYALALSQKYGFRVIPLVPGKKTPLIPNWPNEATTDEAKIREWWQKWPNANLGIVTGAYRDGYFYVLDFDPRNGGGWFDDVGEDVLPPTWVVHTPSGGRHYYYRSHVPVRSAKLPDGVDLKGVGGYVVSPPSILFDDEGNLIGDYGYQVGNMPKEVGIGEGPRWVLDTLNGKGGGAAGVGGKSGGGAEAKRSLWLMPPPIPKGMRHDYLVSLAGAFWSAGLSEREVEAILWAALELLETREDFEPEREIPNIVKGLQRWEGATYTIGSLLRVLPERTAAVVRRVLTGGAVGGSTESNGVVAGQSEGRQSEQPEPPTEANTQPEPQPQAETEPPNPTEAVAGTPQTDADGDKAKSEVGKDRVQAARDIVQAFVMRQRGDGSFCYVYRTPDGNELETASCDPKAVKDFLGRLGLNIPLKDVRALLGLSKETDAGEGEGKSKKKRKAETAEVEDIKAILWRYKWVRWQGDLWQAVGSKIYRADLDRIHSVLKQNGLDVGKETLKSHWAEITTSLPKDFLQGIVVTTEPTYGRLGSLRGLWYRHRGDLYLETPTETRIFPDGQWPEGVYAVDTGEAGVLPDPDGEVKHLLGYWQGVATRFVEDKSRGLTLDVIQRVTLAMYLPVLFGQGHIGIILYGAARSGKSTLLKAMGYLRLGRKPRSPSGLNKRDLIAVLQQKQIVFFDEVNTFSPELVETLKRMITHDGDEIRALYTDLRTVEADLEGSAVFCATSLSQLASDLRTRCFVWHLEEKQGNLYEDDILDFCEALWSLALGGAIKLYRMAARLKRPQNSLLPEIRFRSWLAWAYRYAVVLGVEKQFVDYVKQAKSAAHSGGKYDFLIEVLSQPDFDTSREYTITDLIALVAPTGEATGTDADEVKAQAIRAAKALQYALKSEAVRADLIALARDMGYNLRLVKKREKGEKRDKYRFIFSRLEIPQESNRLQAILESLGVSAKIGDEDDDGGGNPTPPPTPPHLTTGEPQPIPNDATQKTSGETKPMPTENKNTADMGSAKSQKPTHLGMGTMANGQTEKSEDTEAMRFVMERISDIEANGGGDAEVRRFVESYLRRFGDWLKERGCEATLSLLHHELKRLGESTPEAPQTSGGAGTPQPTAPPTPPAGKPHHKTDPKKAPPPPEWVYKAGTPKSEGDAYGGIFAPTSSPQSEAKTNGHTNPPAQNTTNEGGDEEVTDQDIKLYIEQMLIEFENAQLPLTTRLDFLNRFLAKFGEEMKRKGLMGGYNFIVAQAKYLQSAINLRDDE